MAGHETNRAREVGRTIFSALHYLTAFTVVLIFADVLNSNSLRLTSTAELMRHLAEFSNIPLKLYIDQRRDRKNICASN